jgi:hypothetical protein
MRPRPRIEEQRALKDLNARRIEEQRVIKDLNARLEAANAARREAYDAWASSFRDLDAA